MQHGNCNFKKKDFLMSGHCKFTKLKKNFSSGMAMRLLAILPKTQVK